MREASASCGELALDFRRRIEDGEDRMALLKQYASSFALTTKKYEKRKKQWDSLKKRKQYGFHHSTKCFSCDSFAEVRHHVIPLSRGGHNKMINIVNLCRPCHAEIHPWLR